MKYDLYFRGKIVEIAGHRKLEITTRTLYERILKTLKLGNVVLTIKPEHAQRSIQQNRFYWLYLGVISEETGDDRNSLHEFFKRKFLPPEYITHFGETIKIPNITTNLSKSEMVEYMMRIEALTGVPVPDPEAAGFISNK